MLNVDEISHFEIKVLLNRLPGRTGKEIFSVILNVFILQDYTVT
jgi:hypothetical protein